MKRLLAILFLLMHVPLVGQDVLNLGLGGNPARPFSDRSAEYPAYLRNLRTNRAGGGWQLDLVVSNASNVRLETPWVVFFDRATNLTGVAGAVAAEGGLALDISAQVAGRVLAAGATVGPVVVRLSVPRGVPSFRARVFVVSPEVPEVPRIAGRTLDGAGQPLDGVTVEEVGPADAAQKTVGRFGWFSAEARAGLGGWKFSKPGHLDAFRAAASPTLPFADAVVLPVSGTLPQVIGTHALPAPLPLGWSPLVATRFAAGAVEFAVGNTTGSAIVRWDDASLRWLVIGRSSGDATFQTTLAAPAALAQVVPDSGLGAPPAAVVGESLPPGAGVARSERVVAEGRVVPASRPANTDAALVTAEAEVTFRSTNGPIASGTAFRCEVREEYALRDGSRRVLPGYSTLIRGYRATGDDGATLRARFPLRPVQLLGADALREARIRVEVLAENDETLVLLPASGGSVTNGTIRITVPSGPAQDQHIRLRELDAGALSGVVPEVLPVLAVFELDSPASEGPFSADFANQAPGGKFVLARAVFDRSVFGLQPVLCLASDSAGKLTVTEPASGSLRGVDGGGLYALLDVGVSTSPLRGVARNAAGQPAAGLMIRSGPWTALTDSEGRYELLSPAGTAAVSALDLATGDTASGSVSVGTTGEPVALNLDLSPRGPFVVSVSPTNGAVNVARVAPVVVTFSRPLNPATVVSAGAVRLLDTNGTALAASVSLNVAGDALTLLPATQLPASARLVLSLAATLQDRTGRSLEGEREFSFATESQSLRRPDAILTIYEPLNGAAGMSGGAGLAEPDSPVILVNETTGFSATVLSRPDGSFTNSIPADVDDVLDVVIVNLNGSRNVVPASRQEFLDGSVGLFTGGGIVRSRGAGPVVEVDVPPGSIAGKAVLKLETLSAAQVTAMTGPVPIVGSLPLAGFRLEVSGGTLRTPVKVRVPVAVESLTIPAGRRPEDLSFELLRTVNVLGVPAYETVDSARYVNGALETDGALSGLTEGTPPDQQAPAVSLRLDPSAKSSAKSISFTVPLGIYLFGQLQDTLREVYSVVSGKVTGSVPDAAAPVPVAGAAVFSGSVANRTEINVGDRVAITKENGAYSLPAGRVATEGVEVAAVSQFYPNRAALGRGVLAPGTQLLIINLAFATPEQNAASAGDRDVPVISLSHFPASPQINETAVLRMLANDDFRLVSASTQLRRVRTLVANQTVSTNDVTVSEDADSLVSPQTIRRNYAIRSVKPLVAEFEASALDAAGRTNVVAYAVTFGDGSPPASGPDTNDVSGPFVVGSTPLQGEQNFAPGQPVRLRFNEALNRNFLNNPDAVFQLSPSAGPVVAALSDDGTAVDLTWYSLAPGTSYLLTVVPSLYDANGNRFDQNPYNNSPAGNAPDADSFGLRFTTVRLTPAALPGVQNGVGVAALGRRVFVVDRMNGLSGALREYDAEDPSRPSLVSETPLPAFPRAFAVIPQYSYRRTPEGQVETADLLAVAGGTVGGGGQWIRVFTLAPDNSPQVLVGNVLTLSPAATVTKLQWSPPHLGYLEADADTTAVGILNLQLMILAANTFGGGAVDGGDAGLDVNGDGDYVDTGERPPRPVSGVPRLGVINAGAVTKYVAPAGEFRLRDFDMQSGGNFIGAILAAPPSDGRSRYTTFAAGGQPVTNASATLAITGEGKRLFLANGVRLQTPGGTITANLALVSLYGSSDAAPELLVLDITDPFRPVQMGRIRIPAADGIPQSIAMRGDGLFALATANSILLLDPSKLALVPASLTTPHPALVGRLPGFGGGMMRFVSEADGFTASAVGGVAQVAGPASRVNLILHRPGTRSEQGPEVLESREDQPLDTIVFVNDDTDGVPFRIAGNPVSRRDSGINPRSVFDNDFLALRIARLPENPSAGPAARIEIRLSTVGVTNPVAQLIDPLGSVMAVTRTNGTSFVINHALDDATSPFRNLRSEAATVFVEALVPARDILIEVEAFDRFGGSLGVDTAHFAAIRATMTSIWSEQFAGSRANELPSNAGESAAGFIAMANTNGMTRVGARVVLEPDIPAIRERLKGRLFVPHERRLIGASSWTGDEIHVEARDDRRFPRGFGILIFSDDIKEPLNVEELLMVGFDHDGDGILTEAELPVGFVSYVHAGRIGVSSANILAGIDNTHFKVFPEEAYDTQNLDGFVTLSEISGLFTPVSVFRELLVASLGFEPPPTLIATGGDPINAFLPVASMRLANFFAGTSAIGNVLFRPDSVDEYPFPDLLHIPYEGHQKMAHQTGRFDGGFRTLKRYNHGINHLISRLISKSRSMENSIVGIVAVREAVKREIRDELTATGGADFQVSLTLDRENAPAGPENGLMSVAFSNQNSLFDTDLEYGIGNASIPRMTLDIRGHRKVLPDGRSGVEVTAVHFKGVIEDIYDWAWGDNPFGVILEAGHGMYGDAGAPYIQRYEVEGDLVEPIDVAL